jgi:RimJ/RimL family protein N-acetyltransferase
MMPVLQAIAGPNLGLRLISPDDAAYVHALRTNPAYNAHLSEMRGSVADQRAWIVTYKAREAAGQELYFIIHRHDGTPCGTVRLYDIDDDSFTWGSWILDHNKPAKAALESAVLSFGIGFTALGLSRARVDVRRANTHAEAFYRRFGMTETHRSEQDIFFTYPRARFDADSDGYFALLEQAGPP